MRNKRTPNDVFTLRIKGETRNRIHNLALRFERSESWIVKKCVEKFLPELEKREEQPFNSPDCTHSGFAFSV